MNLGIVGAENSHTVAIARTLNIDKSVRGARVTHVWGETRALARRAAARTASVSISFVAFTPVSWWADCEQ